MGIGRLRHLLRHLVQVAIDPVVGPVEPHLMIPPEPPARHGRLEDLVRGVAAEVIRRRDELQALYNGLSELQEYLNGSATLRAVHDAPVPAERDLFLYADYGHRYRYHVSVRRHRTVDLAGARIGSVGETRQDLAVTDLRLDELLARDEGSARYVLTVPPHIARQQDLVRLFLTKFVGVKRRAWRLGHYPVVL